jgi:hypothetical protein
MKRTIINLCVWGVLLTVSACSGISYLVTGTNEIIVDHYSNPLIRISAGLFGLGLLVIAWCVHARWMLGWRLFFAMQVIVWFCFISIGTSKIVENYPLWSSSADLFFQSSMIIVSIPIAIFWIWRWNKKKSEFIQNRA